MKRDPALDAIVVKNAQHYGNCAQTGFFSMVERCNLKCDETAFQHALTAMPGIRQTGETCRGVSGPLLAMGLALGPADPKDKEQGARCFAAARQFAAAVKDEFGSTRWWTTSTRKRPIMTASPMRSGRIAWTPSWV